MNTIIKRWLHKLKANNRHDTHSPFVYDFIEKVLRNKTQYTSDHAYNLSAKIIKVYQPESIATDELRRNKLQSLVSKSIDIFNKSNVSQKSNYLYVFDAQSVELETLKYIAERQSDVVVLILNPHINSKVDNFCKKVIVLPKYDYSIDCFDVLMLKSNSALLHKQHFNLK